MKCPQCNSIMLLTKSWDIGKPFPILYDFWCGACNVTVNSKETDENQITNLQRWLNLNKESKDD